MGEIGGGGPLPWDIGGGKSQARQAYEQIRAAVGVGGSAEDDTGIDGLWRWSKAKGLAVASSSERRAIFQAFPRYATDLIPHYERFYGIVAPAGSNPQQRVEAILKEVYKQAVANTADLASALADLDSRLTLLEEDVVDAIVSDFGRAFEAHDTDDEGPPWNSVFGFTHDVAPNYSTHEIVRVRFELGYTGVLTIADENIVQKAKRVLRRHLPSTVDFEISTETWILGVTPIGYASLGYGTDPVIELFGADLIGYYGADPDSWLTDSSGNDHHLTSIGAAPTYSTVGLRRAIELIDSVVLRNNDIGDLLAGSDTPFAMLVWGQWVAGARQICRVSDASPPPTHGLETYFDDPDYVLRAVRAADAGGTFTGPYLTIDSDSRFFAHSFAAVAGGNRIFVDGSSVSFALANNPASHVSFYVGGVGSTGAQFNAHRIAVVNRAITIEEAEEFRALFT